MLNNRIHKVNMRIKRDDFYDNWQKNRINGNYF